MKAGDISESVEGLDHLLEPVPYTEPISFEMESLERLLSAQTLDHRELSRAVFEIAELGKLSEEWKAAFELCYLKIPANKRVYARDAMMLLYYVLDDRVTASNFLPEKPFTPWEVKIAKWVAGRKPMPRQRPVPFADPDVQVGKLLASLEQEQRARFKVVEV